VSTNRSLWLRALAYMVAFGGTWFVLLPVLLLRAEGEHGVPLRSPMWLYSGVSLAVVGIALSGYAGYHLIQFGKGTPFPLDPTRCLVRTGPYRSIRNPQAVATLLIVLGEVAALRSKAILAAIPLTFFYLEVLAAPFERRELVRRFGDAYFEYQRLVPKWIPRLSRRRSATV
jgi:protein-S-isoprenylcysteine O-methyltransferase Ste14